MRTPPPDGQGGTGSSGLAYVPALDGIRALALIAVLLYHGQVSWMPGGFLGVSVFFTLSGYLITSLVLREHRSTGRIDLPRFWGRRFRRLAPASLATLGVIVAVGAVAGISDAVLADVRAAALYVANWWSLAAEASYAEMFAEPSPTEHFWSLAIEEQFYLAFPVLAWLLLRGDHGPARRRFAVVLVALTVASVAAGLLHSDPNRVYLGTDTRAAELLVGALLAFVWPIERAATATARRLPALGGMVGLAGLVVLCTRTSVVDGWLYDGGLLGVAALSVGLLLGATRPGPLASLLGRQPLRRIGAISYGMYLFHWPVYVVLDPASTGLSTWPLLAVRVAATWALAEVSYRILEQPIRLGQVLPVPRARLALASSMAAVVVATAFVVPRATSTGDAFALASQELPSVGLVEAAASGEASATTVPGEAEGEHRAAPTGQPEAPEVAASSVARSSVARTAAPSTDAAPVIALAGDSVPALLGQAIAPMAYDDFGVEILNLSVQACDGARGAPAIRFLDGHTIDEDQRCTTWQEWWRPLLRKHEPRALVLMLGGAAVLDRQIHGRWTDACQEDFGQWYRDELSGRLDWLHRVAPDTTLFVASSPPADLYTLNFPSGHQQRTECLNRLFDEVTAPRPHVQRLDARSFVCPDPASACRPLREDGVHFVGDGAREFGRWMLEQVTAGW